jgi:hypothetical protein
MLVTTILNFCSDAGQKTGKTETSARRRTCPQCSVVVTSERALVQHLASHNGRTFSIEVNFKLDKFKFFYYSAEAVRVRNLW